MALGGRGGANGRHQEHYDASLHQRFGTEQYFNCMLSVLEEMSYASTRYCIASSKHTRKNCVLGSGLKASKSMLMKTKLVFILRELAA